MDKITILLADDHTILRQGLKVLMEKIPDLEVVGEAGDGEETLKACEELKPEVVIMDVAMPGLSGIMATRQIKEKCPETEVIMLSMYTDKEIIASAIDAGASGFLVKESAAADVVAAIREVHQGNAFFSPAISRTVVDSIRNNYYRKRKKSFGILTTRKREVLQLLAQGKKPQSICEKLFISHNTVQKHRQNIMKKLDIHDLSGLIRYAIDHGIITRNDPGTY